MNKNYDTNNDNRSLKHYIGLWGTICSILMTIISIVVTWNHETVIGHLGPNSGVWSIMVFSIIFGEFLVGSILTIIFLLVLINADK